jgi:hypothetical protein
VILILNVIIIQSPKKYYFVNVVECSQDVIHLMLTSIVRRGRRVYKIVLSGVEYAYCNAYLRICLGALNEKTQQLYDYWYCSRTFHGNSDWSRVASYYVKSRKSVSKRISVSDQYWNLFPLNMRQSSGGYDSTIKFIINFSCND